MPAPCFHRDKIGGHAKFLALALTRGVYQVDIGSIVSLQLTPRAAVHIITLIP